MPDRRPINWFGVAFIVACIASAAVAILAICVAASWVYAHFFVGVLTWLAS